MINKTLLILFLAMSFCNIASAQLLAYHHTTEGPLALGFKWEQNHEGMPTSWVQMALETWLQQPLNGDSRAKNISYFLDRGVVVNINAQANSAILSVVCSRENLSEVLEFISLKVSENQVDSQLWYNRYALYKTNFEYYKNDPDSFLYRQYKIAKNALPHKGLATFEEIYKVNKLNFWEHAPKVSVVGAIDSLECQKLLQAYIFNKPKMTFQEESNTYIFDKKNVWEREQQRQYFLMAIDLSELKRLDRIAIELGLQAYLNQHVRSASLVQDGTFLLVYHRFYPAKNSNELNYWMQQIIEKALKPNSMDLYKRKADLIIEDQFEKNSSKAFWSLNPEDKAKREYQNIEQIKYYLFAFMPKA